MRKHGIRDVVVKIFLDFVEDLMQANVFTNKGDISHYDTM